MASIETLPDEVAGSTTTTTTTSRGHIVVVPLPSQGHVTPALQLAQHLVALGFRITFVNTVYNQERMTKARSSAVAMAMDQGIEFVSVPDGLPEDHPRYRHFEAFNWATLNMGPVLRDLFVTLPPITCVIRDTRMSAAHEVAKKLGIPVVGFATPSAISIQCAFNLPALFSAGLLPLPRPSADCAPSFNPSGLSLGLPQSPAEAAARQAPVASSCVPGVSPTMVVQTLPTTILVDPDHHFLNILRYVQNPLLPDCECILFNTFHDLEGDVLDVMNLNSHVFAVGPLVLNGVGAGSALTEEDPAVLSWLDSQEPTSVLFVSFGSIATISLLQMRELAFGLEMAGAPFLWVVRVDTIVDEEKEEFETWWLEFVLRTKDRSLLVPWAPQKAVLVHPSVAAFLTHCGWNSTIESIVSGVPLLGMPKFGDQTTNAHYIAQVWRIGVELRVRAAENGSAIIPKEEINQKVRMMMAKEGTDSEVDTIRKNSKKFEMAARKAVAKAGTSQVALAKFVEFIESKHQPPSS